MAVRGIVKLPTGKEDGGRLHRQDRLRGRLHREQGNAAQIVELSGYAGYEFRGQPDGFDAPGGAFRWGAGAGYPSREAAARRVRIERRSSRASDTATFTGGAGCAASTAASPPLVVRTRRT